MPISIALSLAGVTEPPMIPVQLYTATLVAPGVDIEVTSHSIADACLMLADALTLNPMAHATLMTHLIEEGRSAATQTAPVDRTPPQ